MEQGAVGPRIHKPGRPKKGERPEQRWNLHVYIAKERQGVYVQTGASFSAACTYWCIPCRREIKFNSATCAEKLRC